MASKLLAVAALFVSTAAAAEPPVDTRRVTGNVSTEHQPQTDDEALAAVKMIRPPIDTCRVTGNILTTTTKGGKEISGCRIEEVRLAVGLFKEQGDMCFADGTPVKSEEGVPLCQIATPGEPILVPVVDPKAKRDS